MRSDREHRGKVERFEDFVLLLRHLENRQIQFARQEEDEIVADYGIEKSSIHLFREVFDKNSAGRPPKVQEQDLKNLLVNTFKLAQSQEDRKKLNAVIQEVAESMNREETYVPNSS